MKRWLLGFALCFPLLLCAQSDNTVYVKQFKGGDVGTKVTNAMATCSTNTSVPCILIVDPSLASYPAGTLPAMCGHCYLQDWRTGSSVASPLNLAVTNGSVNVAQYLSAGDIGQAFTAAYTANGQASYWIPAGNYTTAHTLNFPVNVQGQTSLTCAPGTKITYTGTGDAFAALGTGQSYANVNLTGCTFVGTSSGANGIHLQPFGVGSFKDISVYGFTSGNGWYNEGAEIITCINCIFSSNQVNVHNIGYIVAGSTCWAANAVHFLGGSILNSSEWGDWEDATRSAQTGTGCTVGINENNTFEDMAWEVNGQGGTSYAQAFVQACNACVFSHNYIESGSFNENAQIIIGDGTYVAPGTIIRDNYMATNSGTLVYGVSIVNGARTIIEHNIDNGAETYFVNNGSSSQFTNLGFNWTGAGSYSTGAGTYTAIWNPSVGLASTEFFNPADSTMYLTWSGGNAILRSHSGGTIYLQDGAGNNMAQLTAATFTPQGHVNQPATKDFAGTCAMSSGTSCTFSIGASYTSAPVCVATVQSATVIAGGCTVSGTTVTIAAASSNSSTWGAVLIGNPN